MLRIIQSKASAQAKSYYSTADYYSEGQELVGTWQGKGANALGLTGEIDSKDWEALCDNLNPQTGKSLTQRQKNNRRVGYDFNWHVPKSVSLLYSLTNDDRLLEAFRDSVRETMSEMESEMLTRVRRDGQNEDRATGNMIWGEFTHKTSRPVDGVPDPHLHAHCFVFNATYDGEEERWKAGQFGNLKRDANYFEFRFHLRLSARLQELGLPIERTATGWEVAGLERNTLRKFSRRTTQIEDQAKKHGITDITQKSDLGAKTRERKQDQLSMPELREEWRQRLNDAEHSSLSRLRVHAEPQLKPDRNNDIERACEHAANHLFERKSVIPERTLLAESFKRSVGLGRLDDVEQVTSRQPLLIKERAGQQMATLPTILSEEQSMLRFAREGRGQGSPLAGSHQFRRDWLNRGQQNAVRHVLHSRDRVMVIRGAAGVGKTSMMMEAVEGLQAAGHETFAFAPTAKASRGVLKDEGFAEADTIARLLVDTELQQRIRGQVLWIDEAGLVGSRTMAKLFTLAEQADCRVILSGDRYQHSSVERGAPLRLLETESGLIPAEIKEIQRQRDRYKQAVLALSESRTEDGFQQLDELGWIREAPEVERDVLLVHDYLDAVRRGESALIVSPTHREADRITHQLREQLKDEGRLGTDTKTFNVLKNRHLTEGERSDETSYEKGDVLQFHQNAVGFRKSERVELNAETTIPTDQAQRFQVFQQATLEVAPGETLRITQNGKSADGKHRFHNGDLVQVQGFDSEGNIVTDRDWTIARDFGHFAPGYVVTSYAAQGSSVDRVFIAQSSDSFPASSREQFYVSVSRGKKQATVYTDEKRELLAAVAHSDERITATDLMSERTRQRTRALQTERRDLAGTQIQAEQQRELIHDR